MEFDLDLYLRVGFTVTRSRGQAVYHAGPDALYLVTEGMVRVFHLRNDGKRQLHSRLCLAGDYFGAEGVLGDAVNRSEQSQALSPVVLMRWSFTEAGVILRQPDAAVAFAKVLIATIAEQREQIRNRSFPVCGRVARILLRIASLVGRGAKEVLIPAGLTHEVLGDISGTSREIVTNAVGLLREKGAVRNVGRKLFVRPEQIEQLLDRDPNLSWVARAVDEPGSLPQLMEAKR